MSPKEILQKVNSIEPGKSKRLNTSWDEIVVHTTYGRGIAIKTENEEVVIDEKFNKLGIKSEYFSFSKDGAIGKYIFLYCPEEQLSSKYAIICSNFVEKSNREIIQNRPLDWFNDWATLLGTCNKNKTIYDFIGEMYTLIKLFERGEKPEWDSIHNGTFDIQTDDAIYEVKSSALKKQITVHINSQFQLDTSTITKPLNLVFIRVEKNKDGVSIKDLFERLVSLGYSENELLEYLTSKGYYEGKSEYYEKFSILENRIFKVDQNFPKITADSFKDSRIPQFIMTYEYVVSLDGLDYTTFKED